MAQAITRALIGRLAPEERGELVAGVGVARPDAEIGEQRLGFASGHAYDGARAESGLKPTKERQVKRHDDRPAVRLPDYSAFPMEYQWRRTFHAFFMLADTGPSCRAA